MLHKRTLSDADLSEHMAKVAAAEEDLPAGRPPPSLAAQLASMTPLDIFAHEKEWAAEADALEAALKQLKMTIEMAGVVKVTLAEQKAYDVGPLPLGATIDSQRRLVRSDDDDARLHELDYVDYDIECACCDNRSKSSVMSIPQWRVLGTTRFLCGFCRNSFEAGNNLTVVRNEPAPFYRDD